MAVLLNVQSSPDLEKSASRAVSKAFIDRYVAAHPDTKVVDLDLVATPPTHFGPTHLRAFFATGDEPEPENQAALAASDRLMQSNHRYICNPHSKEKNKKLKGKRYKK